MVARFVPALVFAGITLSDPNATSAGSQEPAPTPSRSIPLAQVHTTSPQKELKHLDLDIVDKTARRPQFKQYYGMYLDNVYRRFAKVKDGASDVELKKADDLDSAILGPPSHYVNGKQENVQPKATWLVARLGIGSVDSPTFVIESVTVDGDAVRLSYRKRKTEGDLAIPYLYWIPLGPLPNDKARAELYDLDEKAVTIAAGHIPGADPADPKWSIDLSTVFSTFPEKPLKGIPRFLPPAPNAEAPRVVYQQIINELEQLRYPGTFLTLSRGDNLESAVFATREVRITGRSPEEAFSVDAKSPSKNYWLAARLPDSTGNDWHPRAVTIRDRTIRFSYEYVPQRGAMGQIVRRNLYWVPLGTLEPGAYELETYDAADRVILAKRRVRVPEL